MSCLLKQWLMMWVKGKRAVRKNGALKRVVTGGLGLISDFSHYLIKWDQLITSTVLSAYIQKGICLDYSGITPGCALSVLSSTVLLSDFQPSLAVRAEKFIGVMRGHQNQLLMAGV